MFANVKNCFCIVAVISALCHLSEALRCYQCDSSSFPACGEPFDHNSMQYTLTPCDSYGGGGGGGYPQYPQNPQNYPGSQQGFPGGQPGGYPGGGGMQGTTCKKTTQNFNGRITVRRSCGGPYDTRDSCTSVNGGYDCNCYGDGCNAGPKGVTASWMTVGLVAILLLVFTR